MSTAEYNLTSELMTHYLAGCLDNFHVPREPPGYMCVSTVADSSADHPATLIHSSGSHEAIICLQAALIK